MAARNGLPGAVLGTVLGTGLGMGAALVAAALALGIVACRSGDDAALDDAAILADVRLGLAQDLRLASSPIRVDVEKRAVILEGRVDRPELREEAERIARLAAGVERVKNRIQVLDTSLPPAVALPQTAEP